MTEVKTWGVAPQKGVPTTYAEHQLPTPAKGTPNPHTTTVGEGGPKPKKKPTNIVRIPGGIVVR